MAIPPSRHDGPFTFVDWCLLVVAVVSVTAIVVLVALIFLS